MDISYIIAQLDANRASFESMLRDVPPALQRWRPHEDHWCLLEVVCHLHDEERDDFRARLRSVLDDPTQELPLTDPGGWVTSRKYLEQSYDEMLGRFLKERKQSITWLKSLENPDWERAYQHAEWGPLRARMFLTTWLAHDYLHIRQITRVKFHHLDAESEDPLYYAGSW